MRRLAAIVVGLAWATFPAAAHGLPQIDVECNQQPVCEGTWFASPVFVDWTVTGGTISTGCRDVTISDDTPGRIEGCAATGGGTASANVTIQVDRSAPIVTDAQPDRPPDRAGWYNRPVAFVAHGSDATSGIQSCVAGQYVGPDTPNATVVATCRDVAGNTASRVFGLRYDATAPDLSAATVKTGDRVVRLAWPAGSRATLTRTPGPGASAAAVYKGRGGGFNDLRVRNGRRYRYVLTVTDEAGNTASRDFTAVPGPRLVAPAKRATVAAPPLLRWTAVRRAGYYNVQLFRGKRKILSAWPQRAQLKLERRWRFGGRRHRLRPGRYRWYVWPGKGPRAANRYGDKIGARSFVVAR